MRPNQTKRVFERLEYPITTADLVEEIGDEEIDLQIGTETVGDVFGRLASETYEDPSEAYTMFLSGLSTKAIGRKGYSDRDPPVQPTTGSSPIGDTPLDADESRCGTCQHVELVGDWSAVGYCTLRDDVVEPIVGDTCSEFERA